MNDIDKWAKEEQEWWQVLYNGQLKKSPKIYPGTPSHPIGLRHYYREMLFRYIRPDIENKIWVDIGAGNHIQLLDLIHPSK